jgi:hypothetical protein
MIPYPVQTRTGNMVGSGTLSLSTWTPAALDLVLVGVHMEKDTPVPTVAGNGLTFVLVDSQVLGSRVLYLFRAQGTAPAAGSVAIDVTGNTGAVVAIATRIAGAHTGGTNGSVAVEVSAKDTGGDDSMLVGITTLTTDSLVVAIGGHGETVSFTTPTGQVPLGINAPEPPIAASMWAMDAATPDAYTIGGASDLDAADDWQIIAVAIRPADEAADAGTCGYRVRVYHGWTRRYLGDLTGLGIVEMSFDQHGPAEARIEGPRGLPQWTIDRLAPGARGVYIEIDGRAAGIPEVWLGQATLPQDRSGAPVTIQCLGPEVWLSEIGVASQEIITRPAGAIIEREIARSDVDSGLVIGSALHHGGVGEFDLSGHSIWSLLTDLEDGRLERFYLRAIPGQAKLQLTWTDRLDARDNTGLVLTPENLADDYQVAARLDTQVLSVAGVANSHDWGSQQNAAAVAVQGSAAMGLLAGLSSTGLASQASRVTGQGPTAIASHVPGLNAMRAILEGEAKRRRTATGSLSGRVVGTARADMWGRVSPNDLVSARLGDESLGLFRNSVGQLTSVSYSLGLDVAMAISAELWALESAAGE